jgi:hypothetical protein
MRCGRLVEIGGFRWKPEEIDSYKSIYRPVFECRPDSLWTQQND